MATDYGNTGWGGLSGNRDTSILGGLLPRNRNRGRNQGRREPLPGGFGAAYLLAGETPPNVNILPPNARELGPVAGLSTDTDQAIPDTSIETPNFDFERPEFLGDWRDQVSTFLQNRMDPNYTAFSPESRRALDRDIGRRHSTALQGISTDIRGRGLGGSGIEAQLRSDAASAAAAQAGDVAGDIAMYDETQRGAAANALDAMRRFDTGDAQFQERRQDEASRMFIGAEGEAREGPVIEQADWLEAFGTQQALDEFYMNFEFALSQAALGSGDILTSLLSNLPSAAFSLVMDFVKGLKP